ncbi:MAG TPA: hypothetical protein VFQ80_09610 [Thermomicrobiales bacterium]|jgi:hypothetical protein|nr:hypothetical protein [Thermomicrobiales bacterium]
MNPALTALVIAIGLSAAVTPLALWRRSWPALTAAAIVSLACCVVGGFTLALLAGFLPCIQLGLAVAVRWKLGWAATLLLALVPGVAWATVAVGLPYGFAFIPFVPLWVVAAGVALVVGDSQWRGTAAEA